MIMVPAAAPRSSAMEMISISSIDLSDAQRIDASASVSDKPLDLDKHRGMAAQKATDIRRILADVENNAKDLRDRQGNSKTSFCRLRQLRGRKRPPRRAMS